MPAKILTTSPWQARWSQEEKKTLLSEQYQEFWQRDAGIERRQLADLLRLSSSPHAVIISGLRRVGKSTLLAQLAHRLGEDAFYYVNFEDERFLGFTPEDANPLYQLFIDLFGERRIFIMDEIQNVPGWERFVRRFIDQGFKFFLSGSNASLLSQELGTRLTGRYLPVELFPFSLGEFLTFKGYPLPDLRRPTTLAHASLQRYLTEYIEQGGIPEPLKYPDLNLRRTLYDDVIHRDITARYRLGDVSSLKELAYHLISNPASLISFNKLKEQLRVGSVNTIKNYIDYLQTSWLLFTLNVYDYSVRRQQIAPKKVYAIDTGLVREIGFSFSPNQGKLLENVVFLALRRLTKAVYYYLPVAGHEVDFYLPEQRWLIQVAQNIRQPQTLKLELRGMLEALTTAGLTRGLLLCDENRDPLQEEGKRIEFRSISEWLLEMEAS